MAGTLFLRCRFRAMYSESATKPLNSHKSTAICRVPFLANDPGMLAQLGSLNETTSSIIKAAIEVHRTLGPGLLESVYSACLVYELRLARMNVETNKAIPVIYKGIPMDLSYRFDLRVENKVLVEVKALDSVLPVHESQLLTYLRLTRCPVGLLINFNVPVLKDGLTRLLNRSALDE